MVKIQEIPPAIISYLPRGRRKKRKTKAEGAEWLSNEPTCTEYHWFKLQNKFVYVFTSTSTEILYIIP